MVAGGASESGFKARSCRQASMSPQRRQDYEAHLDRYQRSRCPDRKNEGILLKWEASTGKREEASGGSSTTRMAARTVRVPAVKIQRMRKDYSGSGKERLQGAYLYRQVCG